MTENQMDPQLDPTPNTLNEQFITIYKKIEAFANKKFNKTDTIFKRNGIDRLNSKLGYFLDNCVPCCATCNTMKMSLGEKEFITHINKISNFFENKGSTTIENILIKKYN